MGWDGMGGGDVVKVGWEERTLTRWDCDYYPDLHGLTNQRYPDGTRRTRQRSWQVEIISMTDIFGITYLHGEGNYHKGNYGDIRRRCCAPSVSQRTRQQNCICLYLLHNFYWSSICHNINSSTPILAIFVLFLIRGVFLVWLAIAVPSMAFVEFEL